MILKNRFNIFKKNKKGFVITADSFFGLMLLSIFLIISFAYISGINLDYQRNISLINSARDMATILEKGDFLEQAVISDSNLPINNVLNSTPRQFCFQTKIFENDSVIIESLKDGCEKNYSEIISVERVFVVREDTLSFHVARIGVWSN